jgi:hypothetical protein
MAYARMTKLAFPAVENEAKWNVETNVGHPRKNLFL